MKKLKPILLKLIRRKVMNGSKNYKLNIPANVPAKDF